MVGLRFTVFGEEIIDRELTRFSARAESDMRPAFMAVQMDIREQVEDHFGSQGSRGPHGAWDPLSDNYKLWKDQQAYSPGTILRAENVLFESLTQEGHPAQVEIIGMQAMEFGSAVEYGVYHQTGTSKMPARQPMDPTEMDKRGWMKQLQHYLVTGELGARAAV